MAFPSLSPLKRLCLFLAVVAGIALCLARAADDDVVRIPVAFSGGHETDPRDGGRPVVLVAGALQVPPEAFRETFTHVHPAGVDSGGPTPDEARANKRALLDGLAKYGVTNDRLDAVSNRYRYVRSRGELWPAKAAVANAVVRDGKVVAYEVIDGGYGYTTPPRVEVPGFPAAAGAATLAFGPDFGKNGSVASIAAPPAAAAK